MEKILNHISKREQLLVPIIKKIEDKLSIKMSEEIENGWFSKSTSVTIENEGVLYDITYFPYRSKESTLVIDKDGRDGNFYNVENYILDHIDFYEVEDKAMDIYESAA